MEGQPCVGVNCTNQAVKGRRVCSACYNRKHYVDYGCQHVNKVTGGRIAREFNRERVEEYRRKAELGLPLFEARP